MLVCCCLLEIVGDLGDAVDRHRERHELDAVGEPGHPEIETAHAGIDVGAGEAEQKPEHHHGDRLDQRAVRQHHRGDQAAHHQREIFGRAELQRDGGERRRGDSDQQRRDAAGEERAERGNAERRPGAALRAPSGARRWW